LLGTHHAASISVNFEDPECSFINPTVRRSVWLSRSKPDGRLETASGQKTTKQKPVIWPEQFSNLAEYVSEPYASMLFVSVWTGLRISEPIGLKWRCIHTDSITVEERYCRGDRSTPKTNASAATIGGVPEVITRIHRLKILTVGARTGTAIRRYQVVKSAGSDDLSLSIRERWAANV